MGFHRAAVPAGDGLAELVSDDLGAVVGEHGVPALDVVEVFQHRLRRGHMAAGAEMPLQMADPQHHLGDGGGTRVDFDA